MSLNLDHYLRQVSMKPGDRIIFLRGERVGQFAIVTGVELDGKIKVTTLDGYDHYVDPFDIDLASYLPPMRRI